MTKANIRRAQSRIESGISNKSELYRWQNQLALAQKSALSALTQTQAAILDLSRALGEKVNYNYNLQKITDEDPFFKRAQLVTKKFLVGGLFKRYQSTFIKQVLKKSPRVNALQKAKDSQDYLARANLHDHFIPSISFVGNYAQNINQEFKTEQSTQFTQNSNEWAISLVATLPIVQGGATEAEESINLHQ